MPFETKQLRVQLPCGTVTVLEQGVAELATARITNWGNILSPSDPNCGPGTSCGFCSGFTRGDLISIEAQVLPALRQLLQARLKELDEAEAHLARLNG